MTREPPILEIERELSPVVGISQLHVLAEVDSTNTYACELGANGAPSGTVVVALQQTAGRGRAGRSWSSADCQQLYFSLIWRIPWVAVRAPQITLDVATSIARSVESETGVTPKLRWPNDVLIGGRKCCGVLTELKTVGDRIDFVVVGIGINVVPLSSETPDDVVALATSLSEAADRPVGRARFAAHLLEQLERGRVRMLERGGFDRSGWLSYAGSIGQEVRVSSPGESPYIGTAVGITASGALTVQRSDGRYVDVIAGDVYAREVH